MSHIEKRRNLWYATLKVPAKLRQKTGKAKFMQSLGTPDKRRAEALARPLVALWQAQLREAGGETDAVLTEAMLWKEAISDAMSKGDQDTVETLELVAVDSAYEWERKRGAAVAHQFADVAFGRRTPASLHVAEWKASITHMAKKSQDQAVKDVERLVARFETLEDITPLVARKWVTALQSAGSSSSSLQRMIAFWRSYWKYLSSIEAVKPNSFPFSAGFIHKQKRAPDEVRAPFDAEAVPALWRAAAANNDQTLADLIELGAYTGARIEELCSLKVEDVTGKSFRIGNAKTDAGVREVPIHSAVQPLMKRLAAASTDGYLLTGLTFNKYGDRSNAIGKRFGRLKTVQGFGSTHVFHSLRKTLITLLEDAGVSENLTADIVGHEKPRITYGLYSGGASLESKAKAMELVRYPL